MLEGQFFGHFWSHMWELLMCGGDIHAWDLLTCGGDIHMWDLLICGWGGGHSCVGVAVECGFPAGNQK